MVSLAWLTLFLCSSQQIGALRIQIPNLDVESGQKTLSDWTARFAKIYRSPNGATYGFDDFLDETVRLSNPIFGDTVPEPLKPAGFKEEVIRKAPHGDSIVSKFQQCKINLIQHCAGIDQMEAAIEPRTSTSFWHIYKNAGTTINKAVLDHGGYLYTAWATDKAPLKEEKAYVNDNHTLQNHHTQQFVMERLRDTRWLQVTFARDPMKRVISAFHENEKNTEDNKDISHDELVAKFVKTVDDLSSNPTQPCQATEYGGKGVHFMLQTSNLVDDFGVKHPIDYIGRSEHIEKELRHLLEDPHYKVEKHHGPNNMGSDEADQLFRLKESDLPLETKKKIWTLYKDDYCCLGMDFPKEAKQQTDLDLTC